MIENPPPSMHDVLTCLRMCYGIEPLMLDPLLSGADLSATVFKAQIRNHPPYFIKVKHGHHHDTGVIITELLQNAGIQQIVPIVKTIDGQSTVRVGDSTIIVYPFVDGRDGFNRDLTDNQWVTLGKVMKQIHEMNVPPSIQEKIQRESYSPKWQQAVRGLYPLLELESIGDSAASDLLTFMKQHKATIHRLVDRAEQLAQKAQEQSSPLVLCHSDLHGGNILISEKSAIYIVDWDDPIMAPKERDLMFIGGGVANVWNKLHESEKFYKGYGNAEINKTLLAYYRHERIVEDIAIYGQHLLQMTEGGAERITWYKQFTEQFDPQGVVEIAFKTDEDLTTSV